MKLLYIENIRFPTEKAHGYQIMKTCEGLLDAQVDVELVVANRVNPIKEPDPFIYYTVSRKFPVHVLPVIDLIPQAPALFQPIAFFLERFTFLRSLRTFLAGRQSQAVYTRDLRIALAVKESGYGPVILELHVLPTELGALAALDAVVCVTAWMTSQVQKAVPSLHVDTIADAVDITCFDPACSAEEARMLLGLDPQKKYLTYGGRFSTMGQEKGLGFIDEAIQKLTQTDPSLELLLIGGDAAEFTRLQGRPPSSSTRCIAAVPRERLAQYYRASTILAMPFPNTPHYAYEMSPLKLFEYMASRVPIVTSDLPSVREILSERTAAFFPPGDLPGLVRTVQALLVDPKKSEVLATAAREEVAAYTWSARARRIANLYQSL